MTEVDVRRAIEAIYRLDEPKLVARMARLLGDLSAAEELAHDAFVAAVEQWPSAGIPENPTAWLMATAKHHAFNRLQRRRLVAAKHREIADATVVGERPELEEELDDDIRDDLLRLVFATCHPLLPTEARVALTLRLVGGLSVEEIARAFVVPEVTMSQRIVRAKRTLSDAKVPFEVPRGEERAERLASVLEVIYLVFNEGYSATAGEHWMRPALCEDGLRLARVLARVAPDESEVQGLLALLAIQASRTRARTRSGGEPVPLPEQDRSLWDQFLIEQGLAALARAEALGGPPGPYQLQAAIAACHARSRNAEETDWPRIAALYGELARVAPSPIVELNRAVAVGYASGPAAALPIVDALARGTALEGSHLLPAVRADLLARMERLEEAVAEFERAAALTRNAPERATLLERAREMRRRLARRMI